MSDPNLVILPSDTRPEATAIRKQIAVRGAGQSFLRCDKYELAN